MKKSPLAKFCRSALSHSPANIDRRMTMKPSFPLLAAISIISASALAYEVLLMRLFSIIQWHHFAYMIISLALLAMALAGFSGAEPRPANAKFSVCDIG